MVDPYQPRRVTLSLIVDAIIVVAAIVLAIYFLVDDTPVAWLVRLAWAGAIVAGGGIALAALARLTGRP